MVARLVLGLLFLLSSAPADTPAPERRPAVVVLETPSLAERLVATQSPEDRRLGRAPRERLFSPEADDYREFLRQSKKDLATRLLARGIVLTGQTETVLNSLLVKATEEELDWLRAQPGVESAGFLPEFRPLLDAALPLVGVPQAWNDPRVGGENNAGRNLKIAIIDSGIDQTHPMLDGSGLVVPSGFPKGDSRFTNGKVIVARNFFPDEPDPNDHRGHGTFVAAIAAGRRAQSPFASIAGVAPGAYLGNYKIFGATGTGSSVITAINSAVDDKMDVLNLSLGSDTNQLPTQDPLFTTIRNTVNVGVVVVAASSNSGPAAMTIASPGILPDVITVGATTNSHTFALPLRVTAPPPVPGALQALLSLPSTAPQFTAPIGAAGIVDVSQLDFAGFACAALPAGSLSGKIALIQRGPAGAPCVFTDKIKNAAAAGALGAVIFNNVVGQLRMETPGAPIPSVSLSLSDGLALRAFVQSNPGQVQAVMEAQLAPFPDTANLVSSFSGRGPSTDFSIKPDLVAPGANLLSAAENIDSRGELYDPSRFTVGDGTSFSTPIVAGAVALLKQARPTLTPAQIKSALVNTATPTGNPEDGAPLSVTNAGAGKLNLPAALSTTLLAEPVSLSFGLGSPHSTLNGAKTVALTNVGPSTASYTVSVVPRYSDPNLKVSVDTTTLTLLGGASKTLNVSVSNTAILQSSYEGFVNIRNQADNTAINVPYWVSFALPEVNAGGVVNGAGFTPAVSPGSIVSLFGLALGGTPAGATAVPLPTTLGGTSVRVNNTNIPLFYSSTGQINAQLPLNLSSGTAGGFVRLNGVAGASFSFTVTDYSPGIFTVRQDGTGPGAILHSTTGVPVSAASPAQALEFVSVFSTGLGQVTSPPQAGAAAGSNPLSTTLTQPSATIGGTSAVVQFSGLAPGFVGLYQVNVQVPSGLPKGDNRLVLTIGGVDSNPVTISVQ